MAVEQVIDKISTRIIQKFYSLFYSCFSWNIFSGIPSTLTFAKKGMPRRRRGAAGKRSFVGPVYSYRGFQTIVQTLGLVRTRIKLYTFSHPCVIFLILRKRAQNIVFKPLPSQACKTNVQMTHWHASQTFLIQNGWVGNKREQIMRLDTLQRWCYELHYCEVTCLFRH